MKNNVKSDFAQLDSRLKAYSTLAAGVIASGTVVNAQIIYTDIVPDTTLIKDYYALDLDNDGTPDFNIAHVNYSYGANTFLNMVGIMALNNNEILGDTALFQYGTYYTYDFSPKALVKNDNINGTESTWAESSFAALYMRGSYLGNRYAGGNWEPEKERFLGLRFKINDKWHYGWARLEIGNTGTSFTIKDYAYEATPDKYILAGMTVSNIVKANDDFTIYSGAKQLFVHSTVADATAAVYNISGQELLNKNIHQGKNIIELSDLPAGIYIIKVQSDNNQAFQKFLIR